MGQSIAKNADIKTHNPYQKWIETYSSKEFSDSVQKAISIFDEISLTAPKEVQNLMLEAFYKSTVLEWHFWNDSYNQTVFDDIK